MVRGLVRCGYTSYKKIQKDEIVIPVTASGEMDYDFMVLFVRVIIKRTIRGVVESKNREIAVEREGRVLLVQYRGESDPETGGAYTVKRYVSKDSDPGLGDDVMLKPITGITRRCAFRPRSHLQWNLLLCLYELFEAVALSLCCWNGTFRYSVESFAQKAWSPGSSPR